VLQSPYLFHATVERNVGYGLAVRGISKKNRLRRVREALKWVGLEGFEGRPHHALSGGEAQRVALARTLITGPRTLLLDEFLANVDAVSRTIIERVLVNANRHWGVSVLCTTHDLDQAYRIADEVTTLNAGMVVEGPMENVYHGAVYQDGDHWVFDTAQLSIAIPAGHEACRTAAISPEAILIRTEKVSTSLHNMFRGRIRCSARQTCERRSRRERRSNVYRQDPGCFLPCDGPAFGATGVSGLQSGSGAVVLTPFPSQRVLSSTLG
jgi:ABC-type sulfate/molybdate transport systems ATPase subunit